MKSIIIASLIISLMISGCGTFAMQSQAKMTRSVFLKELNPEKTILLVNTGLPNNLVDHLIKKFEQKGYLLVDKEEKATYVLRVNMLNQNGQQDQNAVKAAATVGVGSGLVGYAATGSGSQGLGAALAGAAIAGTFAWARRRDI